MKSLTSTGSRNATGSCCWSDRWYWRPATSSRWSARSCLRFYWWFWGPSSSSWCPVDWWSPAGTTHPSILPISESTGFTSSSPISSISQNIAASDSNTVAIGWCLTWSVTRGSRWINIIPRESDSYKIKWKITHCLKGPQTLLCIAYPCRIICIWSM